MTGTNLHDVHAALRRREQPLERLLALYRVMRLSRCIDDVERELVQCGQAFFHVSSAGHEGMAALAPFLTEHDWLHLHYRDKALMLARGLPPEMFFHSLLCNGASHSAGRQMSAHMSDPSRRILSVVGPVGNNALQAVGVAEEVKNQPQRPIVVCALGDGTSQQGEVMEGIAEAVRSTLPVLFVIEDNRLAISTRTCGKTFYCLPGHEPRREFYGISLDPIDARDPAGCCEAFAAAVSGVRKSRGPAIAVCRLERLHDHTNSDDQDVYRAACEVQQAMQSGDPVENLAQYLRDRATAATELSAIDAEVLDVARAAAADAMRAEQPTPVNTAKSPILSRKNTATLVSANGRRPAPTMLEAIRGVFRRRLEADPRVALFGQDIEDPEGDVFGVTRGLSQSFPGRVVDAPLSESTIVGKSIGRALAGGFPVAFIQFADFIPLAFNQILSEMGSMYWRTSGAWQCPMIVMAPCGGYRPGLGPFHAQTMEALLAHVPGIDVLTPSTAEDASELLDAAFDSGRPTVFLYPKVCLNDRARSTASAVPGAVTKSAQSGSAIGTARRVTKGSDLTLVTWGSTAPLCERAVAILNSTGKNVELLDLRSISPWDASAVIASVRKTSALLVVHEDNITCGFGAEVVATVAEAVPGLKNVKRVARPDTFVPCNFTNQLEVLPSLRRIVSTAAGMIGFDVRWKAALVEDGEVSTVEAVGSSPADQTVTVLEWKVAPGQAVRQHDVLAEIEADKSILDLTARDAGTIEDILVPAGTRVPVHTPLMRVRLAGAKRAAKQVSREEPGEPVFTPRDAAAHAAPKAGARPFSVFISRPSVAFGSRVVPTEEIARTRDGWSAEDAAALTGVRSRHWVTQNEDVVSLATSAAQAIVKTVGNLPSRINCVICSTTSPNEATPSISCRVAGALAATGCLADDCHAFDINAACSGYLYGLRCAADYLTENRSGVVLLLTAEVLSSGADPDDFNTAFLFGDAATASLVTSEPLSDDALSVSRPLLRSKHDPHVALRSPCIGNGYIKMDGITVAREANKAMSTILTTAAAECGLSPCDLSVVIPHPGSIRILQSVGRRLEIDESKVLHTLSDTGNTSSSSIPIALDRFWSDLRPNEPIGLVAFGAGFTSAAATAYRHHPERGSEK